MVVRKDRSRSSKDPLVQPLTFELERFSWGAPDRLELSGTFAGLRQTPAAPPVLVVRGAEATHRLAAAPAEESGAPENGQPWHASFVWREAPTGFEHASLELGDDIVVDLPDPGWDGESSGVEILEAAPVETPPDDAIPGTGAERLRFQAELLALHEQVREAQAAVERVEAELGRARADLEAEREGRAADAARFKQGLAHVRESAEQALDVEAAARMRAESETEELRERVDALADTAADVDQLRADLTAARAEADGVRAELATARSAIDATRADAQRLLERLAGGDPRGPED